jgi:uroporphyrinogen-III decarboxylase
MECQLPKYRVNDLIEDSVPVVGLAELKKYCKENKFEHKLCNCGHKGDVIIVHNFIDWAGGNKMSEKEEYKMEIMKEISKNVKIVGISTDTHYCELCNFQIEGGGILQVYGKLICPDCERKIRDAR